MDDYKDGEIILCSNIHIDKNYDNVLDVSKSTLVGYLRTHSEYVGNDYTIIPRYKNRINVSCPYKIALKCNYMTFKNPDYDNEYCFAFVDSVDYVSDETCNINYTLDVWHTNHDKFNINKVFVEREHVSDDTIGKHTIPENLETGEFVINATGEVLASDTMYLTNIYIGVSKLAVGLPGTFYGNNYGGIYSGCKYFMFDLISDAGNFIKAYDGMGLGDNIQSVFLLPKAIFNPPQSDKETWTVYYGDSGTYTVQGFNVTQDNLPLSLGSSTIYINDKLNGYTPRNNKLFTGDYNYLYITNNAGTDVKYNYEDFIDNTPSFVCKGSISVGGSIKLYPQKYKLFDCSPQQGHSWTGVEEYNYGISCGKYPTCSWSNDAYTNWLTQNATQMNLQQEMAGLQMITSFNNMTTGDIGKTIEGVGSGIGSIANIMVQKKMHSYMPNQSKGSVNSGDITLSTGAIGFYFQKMSIRAEYAKIIDDYFQRFGYQINEIKQPTLHNRTQFDFIKVGGTDNLISGKIPSNDLHEINNIARRGVTIFHNIANFGNYTIDNPIVTP